MDTRLVFHNIKLKKLNIINFAGKRGLIFELSDGTNIFAGRNCCGKTTVCDFIRFMFYGSEGSSVIFPWSGEKMISGELCLTADGIPFTIRRTETLPGENGPSKCTVTDSNGIPLPENIIPGEYFLGCSSFIYDRTVYLPQKQNGKITSDITLTDLDKWAYAFTGKEELFSLKDRLSKEKELLMNDSRTGEIDGMLNERSAESELSSRLEEKRAEYEKAVGMLSETEKKISANNKRSVILKANMKSYTDDIKLTENRENAADLKNEIQRSEKDFKMIRYNAQNSFPDLTRGDISMLSSSLSDYSEAMAGLSGAKERLVTAEENYTMNKRLFSDGERDDLEDTADLLESKHKLKNLFVSLATLFVLTGIFVFCYLYFAAQQPILLSALIGGAVLIFAAMLFLFSSMFKKSASGILRGLNLETQSEFDNLFEQYTAFKASDETYTAALEAAKSDVAKAQELADGILGSVRTDLLSRLAEDHKTAVQIKGCDDPELADMITEVISAYNTMFEAEDDIAEQKEAYRQLLSKDVSRDTLEISSEFLGLEKELAFITNQNAQLVLRKEQLEETIRNLRAELDSESETIKNSSEKKIILLERLEHYRELQLRYDAVESEISNLEDKVLQPVSARVNALISFALKSGESFILGEKFEFKYKRGSQTMMFSKAGGGLSELALIALRTAIAEQLVGDGVPMIFDESFMFVDTENARSMCRILSSGNHQLIMFTSAENDATASIPGAKVFSTEDFAVRT